MNEHQDLFEQDYDLEIEDIDDDELDDGPEYDLIALLDGDDDGPCGLSDAELAVVQRIT